MNRKGFTLIEVIAIIIILGILLVIIVPNVFSTINNTKEDVYKIKKEAMVKAAKDYVMYNNTVLPEYDDTRIEIRLNDLVDDGFISEILDLDDNSSCFGSVIIEKLENSSYSYYPCLFCSNYQTDEGYCEPK